MAFIENAVTKAILDRRSIRKYKPDPVTQDQLDTILHCAFNAPSGVNKQDWFISVIRDKELMETITQAHAAYMRTAEGIPELVRARFENAANSFFGADVGLFFSYPKTGGEASCFIMAENVCIAAQSLGLGTCYLGGIMMYLNTPEGLEMQKKLGVPEDHRIAFGMALGVPDESPEAKERDETKFTVI